MNYYVSVYVGGFWDAPLPPPWRDFTPPVPMKILPVIAGAARRLWRIIFLPRWRIGRWKAKT